MRRRPKVVDVTTTCLSRMHSADEQWVTLNFRAVKADAALICIATDEGHRHRRTLPVRGATADCRKRCQACPRDHGLTPARGVECELAPERYFREPMTVPSPASMPPCGTCAGR